MATVIVVKSRDVGGPHGDTAVFGTFDRDELKVATRILANLYPNASLKRYQLRPLPTPTTPPQET